MINKYMVGNCIYSTWLVIVYSPLPDADVCYHMGRLILILALPLPPMDHGVPILTLLGEGQPEWPPNDLHLPPPPRSGPTPKGRTFHGDLGRDIGPWTFSAHIRSSKRR